VVWDNDDRKRRVGCANQFARFVPNGAIKEMSNPSSKSSEQQQPKEPKGQLLGGLPFMVGAAQWHASSWASLKPIVKPGLPTPEQDKAQDKQDQSNPIQFHKFSPIP
jgi:hypothetical protein